jgi:uncharacterized membrane-anchored protein
MILEASGIEDIASQEPVSVLKAIHDERSCHARRVIVGKLDVPRGVAPVNADEHSIPRSQGRISTLLEELGSVSPFEVSDGRSEPHQAAASTVGSVQAVSSDQIKALVVRSPDASDVHFARENSVGIVGRGC